ncbi:MAG: CRTAC1 family protein [Planctomycetota bacterium]|nr:MAG: CRTAC1 family protein [Planctomycetota bacterium]
MTVRQEGEGPWAWSVGRRKPSSPTQLVPTTPSNKPGCEPARLTPYEPYFIINFFRVVRLLRDACSYLTAWTRHPHVAVAIWPGRSFRPQRPTRSSARGKATMPSHLSFFPARPAALLIGCCLLATSCSSDRGPADSAAGPRPDSAKEPQPAPRSDRQPTVDSLAGRPVGHQRMVRQLGQIAARVADEHYWLGDARARRLRERKAALSETASASERAGILFELATAESALGNEQAAIENLEALQELRPQLQGILRPAQLDEFRFRLALSHLRFGETQNCCKRHTADSCLLPIRGGGIHTDRAGSQAAARHFSELLQLTAGRHLRARWLLNLAHMTLDGYPQQVPAEARIPPGVFRADEAFPRLRNVAPRLGLDTFNLSGSVVVEDFDNDDDLDVLTSSWDPSEPLHYFRNDGDGTFREQGDEAGLAGIVGGINMVQADYDNDGDTDVFVIRGAWLGDRGRHPNSLLRNDGQGVFTDVTFAAGLGESHYPAHSAAWADYDNDGDLDLYVANEMIYYGSPVKPSRFEPAPSQLFRNDGNGSFTDVAAAAGVTNLRYAKAAVWGDYDGDAYPDLYVSNYRGWNRLYRNRRDGTFVDVAGELGVDGPQHSFPVWFWDTDNDGHLDLFVPSYYWNTGALRSYVQDVLGQPIQAETSRSYRGDGQGGFEEVAVEQGLARFLLPMSGNFGDVDNDGFLDLYLGTGYPDYEALLPNVLLRNDGGGGFVDVTYAAGLGHLQKGHGIAMADLDQDGDVDIFAQMGGAFRGDKYSDALFENPGSENQSITIQLVGTESNRSAIGAILRLEVDDEEGRRTIYRRVNSGGSFGANPLRQTIGLGRAEVVSKLEVTWPTSGLVQTFRDVAAGQFVRITEGSDAIETIPLEPVTFGGAPTSR